MARTSSCPRAPLNCPKFKHLCKLLRRNDATTNVVETWRAITPFGYGERLGTALQNNTVVSTLFLQLSFLLSEKEMELGATDSADRLLHYLEHSASLQSLTLAFWKFNYRYRDLTPTGILLLERILNAALQNPVIRSLHLDFPDLPLSTLIQFLSVAQPRLTTFSLHSYHDANSNAMAIETAAAQIFGMLPSLEELKLNFNLLLPF
jgi:hypothetical protein